MPPLLFFHAFPLDASMWEPQVAEFGDEFRTFAPDFPGFGGSAPATGTPTMDTFADRGEAALRAADLDRAVVVGLSMGGYAALAFWRRYPQLVAGLVLANTRAGGDDGPGRDRRYALAERLRSEDTGFLVAEPPPLLSAAAPGELWAKVKDVIARQPAEAIAAASIAMAHRPDSTPDLPLIDVPVLVISSSGDTLIPADATRPMADALPDARYEEIEGAGHLSNLEAPAAFNALLRGHLRRCVR